MKYNINNVQLTSAKLKEELQQFYGTENYFTCTLFKFNYTDGVKYFAEKAGAYWLLQEINILTTKLPGEFFSIKVVAKNKKADIFVDDGNDYLLNKRHIALTDLPEGEWTFFLTNNVLLLPSEY